MKRLRFLLFFIGQLLHCPESFAIDTIPPKLNLEFIHNNHLSVMLTMEHSVNQVFNSIKARRFANSDERTTAMVAELQEHTANSQKPVLDHLSRKSSFGKITSFWITNKILIEKATRASIVELLELYGFSIQDVHTVIPIYPLPVKNKDFEDKYDNYDNVESDKGFGENGGKPGGEGSPVVESMLQSPGIYPQPGGGPVYPDEGSTLENWGVANVGADIAHEAGYNGRGKVIGIIDSGARWTHETLRDNMRPTYNWFDSFNGSLYPKPIDGYGHGTFCTALAAGKLGIGVAPGSEWISCRIFYNDGSSAADGGLGCGQWMLCPTLVDGSEPDCSMRPDVVSNSWGYGLDYQMAPDYDDVIAAWQIADITPVFAAGNNGPRCASMSSPADGLEVIAVGNTNINNLVTYTSSLGPTSELHARIKPDICAPGRYVLSASYIADTQYLFDSGTSMSTPNVAGAVAVYKQKYPDATFTQILKAFQNTAYQWRMSDDACNYKSTNVTTKWPNNYCGYGILRLNAALGITGKPTGGSGWNN